MCVFDFVRMWFPPPPPPPPPLSLFATAETMSRKLMPIFVLVLRGQVICLALKRLFKLKISRNYTVCACSILLKGKE